jgi:tryptophan 2,3-dioxygenase
MPVPPHLPDPWWSFSLDPAARADADARRLHDAEGRPLVNAPGEEGRLSLRYGDYLGLEQLLGAQTPASTVPDERVFIVIHQLFELVFKQMTFDLGVLARTFEALLDADDAGFQALALEPLPDERGPSAFWRPAMTAAARLRHSARTVLPAVMTYVGQGEDDDVLFSTVEYNLFRDFLAPASGFQTAQLRLIQRALGKTPLLGVRVFPGGAYGHHYAGCPAGHVALSDPLILGDARARAFPPEGDPAHVVARLDDRAHAALARLAPAAAGLPAPPSVRTVHAEEVERAAARVRATLGDHPEADAIAEAFRADLGAAAGAENDRRAAFADARRGAQALHARHHRTCLAFALDRLAATDAALHAPDPDSFLTVHRKTVRRHVAGDAGTGGGGMPYLVTSQRFLLPLFPALVAYADLGVAGTAEDRERW